MKSVLRSIKPYYLYLIITGRKTVEVGKDFPKSSEWDRTVEFYCSKDKKSFKRIPEADRAWMQKYLGKVACRFVCDNMEQVVPYYNPILEQFFYGYVVDLAPTCLCEEELHEYAGIKPLYFWHISDLTIYETPKELSEFSKICSSAPDAKCYPENCERCPWNAITRPPQNWFYVGV